MVLKSVGVLSAGKVMGVLGVFGGLIAGGFMALISLLSAAVPPNADAGNAQLPAMFVGVGAVIFLPIFYGIFGFISGLLYAWFYNIVAGFVGGLELDLEPRTLQ